jgi:hypothetical protein
MLFVDGGYMRKERKLKNHEKTTPFRDLFGEVRLKKIPVKPPKNGVLSEKEALKLFDWLRDMKDLRHDYSNDLCYARAELMCHRLKQAGFTPHKARAWPYRDRRDDIVSDETLRRSGMVLSVSLGEGRHLMWGYHVALSMQVEIEGEVQTMIFDPALFDGPASRSEWATLMNTRSERVSTWEYESPGPIEFVSGYSPAINDRLSKHPLVDAREAIATIDEDHKVTVKPQASDMRARFEKLNKKKAEFAGKKKRKRKTHKKP